MTTKDEQPTIDSSSGALGISMTAFVVSINTLAVLVNKGAISDADALEVINRTYVSLKNSDWFPEDTAARTVALDGLDLARQLYLTATAQKPTDGKH